MSRPGGIMITRALRTAVKVPPAGTTARHRAPGAYYGHMGRIIGTILGAILAIWGIFTAIGWFSAMLKTFVITFLIAAVVFIIVWLLAGRRRQD
jgi:predicted lipid-binding transport protein (Tim44 family)